MLRVIPAILLLLSCIFPHCSAYTEIKNFQFEDSNNEDVNEKYYVNSTAVIITNWGTIKIMLYDLGAPITVQNFINLSDSKFYDDIKFHRVIDDFVIQTGDPNTKDDNPYNDGWGGSDSTIPLEINDNLTHVDGAVGMARGADPDSASSQFYICDGPQHQLDGDYAVFGVVIEGMEVVRKIASAETYGYKRPLLKDHPVDDIIMLRVYIIHGGYVNKSDVEEKMYFTPISQSLSDIIYILVAGVSIIILSSIFVRRKILKMKRRVF